jgi:GH35 family endo-1,4-beta-xylanase
MWCSIAPAQVSTNPNKFLGNITTWGSVDAGGGVPAFYTLWNQITCENESKWSSVEGTRGTFNWGGANNAFNYAKQHDFTYKFHALVWGAQYPGWLSSLSPQERFAALTNWFDHAKAQYSTLPMIDVVNEAVGNHQAGNPMMKETLGGGGKTGYDWLIKAFEMAYERWPDAILIYNDFNSIRYDIDNYITLVQTLRDAGAPIDAYGNQAHELSGCSASELSSAMQKQQNALKMPMFITEYDIGDYEPETHGATQKSNFEAQIPVMWEAPYCAGITLWGYVYGKTWINLKEKDNPYQDARDEYGNLIGPGISGLYLDGEERPAMTWLREYMESDAARNAVGPFPGTKKEASIYIRPAALKVAKGDVLPIKIRARLATKTIEKVDFYVDDELVETMTEEPYIVEYTASTTGTKNTKAVVTATDGSTYERYGRFNVSRGTKRSPYNDVIPQLPGTINATEYDNGMSGVTYNNASRSLTTTKDGQWMEYTVDVLEDGYYTLEAEVASTKTGGMFHLAEYSFDNLIYYTDYTDVPNTGSTTTYQTVRCPMKEYLTAGRHVFTLLIDTGGFYIKSLTFKSMTTFTLPGTIEAEDFCMGGDGMEVISDNGGYVLSNANNSKWAEYLVDITQSGKYSYEVTASADAESKLNISLVNSDGSLKNLITITLPKTGSLNTYQVKTGTIRNKITVDGLQKLRFTITSGNCNIDNVKLTSTETGIGTIIADEDDNAPAYNLQGARVGDDYRGIVIINGKKVVRK